MGYHKNKHKRKKNILEGEDTLSTLSNIPNIFYTRGKQTKFQELEQVKGPGSPQRFPLKAVKIIIGRTSQSNICINSLEISREHMLVKKNGQEYICEDMDSKNGVYLNGIKIHSAILRNKDIIQIGDTVFVYHENS